MQKSNTSERALFKNYRLSIVLFIQHVFPLSGVLEPCKEVMFSGMHDSEAAINKTVAKILFLLMHVQWSIHVIVVPIHCYACYIVNASYYLLIIFASVFLTLILLWKPLYTFIIIIYYVSINRNVCAFPIVYFAKYVFQVTYFMYLLMCELSL